MKTINAAKAHAELQAAGVRFSGVSGVPRSGLTGQDRCRLCDDPACLVGLVQLSAPEDHDLAAAILAAHDPAPPYTELRAKEYPTLDEMVVALIEKIGENRPEAFDALMAKRAAIKLKYPKRI